MVPNETLQEVAEETETIETGNRKPDCGLLKDRTNRGERRNRHVINSLRTPFTPVIQES